MHFFFPHTSVREITLRLDTVYKQFIYNVVLWLLHDRGFQGFPRCTLSFRSNAPSLVPVAKLFGEIVVLQLFVC